MKRKIELGQQRVSELGQRHRDLQEAGKLLAESLAVKQGKLSMIVGTHHSQWRPAGALGRLNDFVELSDRYEKAITAALGKRLQAWIMEDHRAIAEALVSIKQGEAGDFHFVPKTTRNSPAKPVRIPAGVLGPAVQFARCRPPYESLIAALLDGVYIVESLETAVAIWQIRATDASSATGRGVADPGRASSGWFRTAYCVHQLENETRIINRSNDRGTAVETVQHQI
jgi:chromosome segregation ATPase